MKAGRFTVYVGAAAIVLGSAAPGFAQQAPKAASCPAEVAQVRAQIWRAQAAMEIAGTPTAKAPSGRALASQIQGAPTSGAGRVPGSVDPSGGAPTSGAGRALATAPGSVDPSGGKPTSGAGRVPGSVDPSGGAPTSGAGRALATAPVRQATPGRVSSSTNAQFRVLTSNDSRKAFVETLNEQERSILYNSLSPREKKIFSAAMGTKDMPAVSEQDAKAWAEKIASTPDLSKKVAKARTLAREAQAMCATDAAGATAKAKEGMEALK
jgi:hypothetical protein